MNREPFSIHPTLQAHIDPLTEEEFRLLEESILAEGVRDPLVVWREENVLVDGHHRKAICDRHGLPYSVTYLSLPDIDAAKAWMDLNQLGRRNLTKGKRDEMIRRLAARGVKQKDIAEKVGMTEARISQIAKGKNLNNLSEPTINAVSPSAEIESLQRKLEEAEAARRSTEQRLSAVQSDLKLAKMALDVTPEVVERDKDFLRSKLKEEQERHDAERKELIAELNAAKAKVKQGAPEVVEKEVVREVVPDHIKQQLARLEGDLQSAKSRETELERLIQDAKKHGKDIETLLSQKNDIQKSLKELAEKNDLAQEERQQALALVSAARKIREVLNEQKGLIEEASRKGVPAWANAVSIRECAERCYEIGDLLTKATKTIDIPTGTEGEYERHRIG